MVASLEVCRTKVNYLHLVLYSKCDFKKKEKEKEINQAWKNLLAIQLLRKMRQENFKFKACVG